MKFNTAIAALMALINEIYDHGSMTVDELKTFVTLLKPFAPHLTEEIWEAMGGEGLLSLAPWPVYEEAKTVDATVDIAVQINGKVRCVIKLSKDTPKDEALIAAKTNEKIRPMLEGRTIVKEVCVPNKIINFVVKNS